MHRVRGGVQYYTWGKPASESWIKNFTEEPQENKPYAEYWLGTHPSLPTTFGSQSIKEVTGELNFLFKALAVAKPLSIQVHPNKVQAQELYSQSPHLYPDSNYKPEMCIAMSPMKLFYGFKSSQEIQQTLDSTPELRELVGNANSTQEKLQKLFEDETFTLQQLRKYLARAKDSQEFKIYEKVHKEFPEDVGLFFVMFMHYLELSPGEAVEIHPGVPHCYLEGECLEAMACSDNVVRAGLTSKHKDVATLLRIVDYPSTSHPKIKLPKEVTKGIKEYPSSYPDFKVVLVESSEEVTLDQGFPFLGIVLEGSATTQHLDLQQGSSYLILEPACIQPTPYLKFYLCGVNS